MEAELDRLLSNAGDPTEALGLIAKDLDALEQARKARSEKITLQGLRSLSREPLYRVVGIEEFVESKQYLGKKDEVYPKVMEHLIEINSGKYDEVVFTGAIGTAKSTLALWTTAYQLHLLGAYPDPHAEFGIDRSSEILFVFQSISAKLAKAVDFDRFSALIRESPFFNEVLPYDHTLVSELYFPRRIIVRPVSGAQTATIGQNVFGGIIDEVNYMARVEKSMNSTDGGAYDQAIALYNSIARRRKSRFMFKGRLPGILCLVSSKRYPGQFTDVKEEEANNDIREKGYSTIYVYDKRTWDVLPDDRFSGEWFNVFVGDASRQPRVMGDNEGVSPKDRDLVLKVPVEYGKEFRKDIYEALREIGGVATLARYPFFVMREKLTACFGEVDSILNRTEAMLGLDQVICYPDLFESPEQPRWCHIDLGLVHDAAGFAIGYVKEFLKVDEAPGVPVMLPHVVLDCTLRIKPPPAGEIQFAEIRKLIFGLRDKGLNIQFVSFDSWQSADSRQILQQKGMQTGVISMDVNTQPYNFLKALAYTPGCLDVPDHPHLLHELVSLERDQTKDKVDHPPRGSKDVADALAGVVFGLGTHRSTYARFGIPPRMISSVVKAATANKVPQVDPASPRLAIPSLTSYD
jgi:hypothetical protein